MTTLPSWWRWRAADAICHPIAAVSFVEHADFSDPDLWVASTSRDGGLPRPWSFMIDDGELHVIVGGFATENAARRACERVYVAATAALNAPEGELCRG
jgi:hypothetical protein